MDPTPIAITILGGIMVIISYFMTFNGLNEGYIQSRFWLDMPTPVVYVMVFFQVLAVIGFFMFMIPWLFIEPPKGGVLGNSISFVIVLAIYFIASSIWAPAAYNGLEGNKTASWLSSGSLVVSAICSILFIAGAVEENEPRWYVVLGTILFGITVVLGDGVAWNAKFIKNTLS